MTILAMAFFFWTGAAAVPPAPETITAAWKPFRYSGPNHRYDDCAYARMALEDLLASTGARRVRADCSWNYGLSASWESLAPEGNVAARRRLENAVLGAAGPLPGAARRWSEIAPLPETVQARWVAATVFKSVGDLRACNVEAEVMEHLLSELPVRNVAWTVFCNPGSGVIQSRFEYLDPD
jgi:hypothetical protein